VRASHYRSPVAALLAAALAAFGARAAGPDLVVNTALDDDDGTCTAAAAGCTLREAILAVDAGTALSIGFDPVVFPLGNPATILLATPLPPIARSGASVDGAGAGVVISGGGTVTGPGLVFSTPAGVPLARVRAKSLAIEGFSQHGLVVCAGDPPGCNAALSDVLVQDVVVRGNTQGILIDGETTSGAAVVGCVVGDGPGTDIVINAAADTSRVSVIGSTVRGGGIVVNAGSELALATIADNVVVNADDEGIVANAGEANVKPKISGNRVVASATLGILVNAGALLVAPRIEGNHVASSTEVGIALGGADGTQGGRVARNVLVSNLGVGLVAGKGLRTSVDSNRLDDNGGGLEIAGGGGNRVKKNVLHANHTFGLSVTGGGTDGNLITGNRALGNGNVDLEDQTPGCGTNRWRKNTARTASEVCVLGAP
jgi:CSLREA domain-containing protein